MAPFLNLAPPLIGFPGGSEWIVVLVLVLIIFGPKQLPKIGRALGGGIKEFKDGLKTGVDDEDEEPTSTTTTKTTVEVLPPSESTSQSQTTQETREAPRDSSSS
jgi:sec-independent protein translocase protein TatA